MGWGGLELGGVLYGRRVLVLGEVGVWSHVRIGHVEGYMMSAYLAPGDQGVEVRGVQLSVREELVGQDIPLYTQPDESSAVVAQVYNTGPYGLGRRAVLRHCRGWMDSRSLAARWHFGLHSGEIPVGREWMMEDGGRGDKGDVTFFSEESNKEPVL